MTAKVTLFAFRRAIEVFKQYTLILEGARADDDITSAMVLIVKHLESKSKAQVLEIIGSPSDAGEHKLVHEDPLKYAEISLDDIEAILADPDTGRRKLEAIAVGRFKVPKGSLRSIGNLANLRQKISTAVDNERAHETIGSVARSDNRDPDVRK